ncbi:MAG: type II toxin-antitoxin system YafQ family toxin [Synergistaceae bacterium]|jgi:mRNA interferase YafQ|nr:type II toxin-antitoxin system YafQ family toxin [Synergistaceae bacterium]
MRSVKLGHAYKKDFRREARGENLEAMAIELSFVVTALAADAALPEKYQEHLLTGRWAKHGGCHIKPDFVLIYLKTANNELHLVRLGSHAELFGM